MISATHDTEQSFDEDEYNLQLPNSENKVKIFKDYNIESNLLGVGKVKEYGCDVHFNDCNYDIKYRKTNKLIAHGYLDPVTNHYYTSLKNISHDVTTPVGLLLPPQNT